MNTTMRMILGLSLCWLAACADVPEASPEAGQEAQPSMLVDPAAVGLPAAAQPQAPVLPVPENVQVDGTYLFSMETEPEIVELTLHGTVKDRLAGRLADDEGRRKIVYYGPDYRAPQTLFAADWLLPAVGAVNKAGEMLVCVNRLVGAPSVLTKGNVPDPANGVDLVCHAGRDLPHRLRGGCHGAHGG
jgi:hypothetical protein